MKFFMITPYYVYWHYTRGITDLANNLMNFIKFEFDFFSVKDLLLTLFSPFQRLKENYGNSIVDFENIAAALVVNIVMRIIGFFIRIIILSLAFVSLLLSCILFPILLLAWLVLPLILVILLGGSIWAYFIYKP
jgi:hypothetical protein